MSQLVSLDIVKDNLGLKRTSEYDEYLTRQIEAASGTVEDYCRRKFEAAVGEVKDWSLYEDFDDHRVQRVFLERIPITQITSIVATDWEGVTHSLSTEAYGVKAEQGYVFFPLYSKDQDWRVNLVKLTATYDGGYATVPSVVQQVVSDIVRSRFYRKDEDPGRIIRAESVPDVGSVSYDTGGGGEGSSDVSLNSPQRRSLYAYRINLTV